MPADRPDDRPNRAAEAAGGRRPGTAARRGVLVGAAGSGDRDRRSDASRRPVTGAVVGTELVVSGLAVGGDGVGRAADGRVVFVRGGVPGDRLGVRVVDARRRFVRAELVTVLEPGPARVVPPCPNVARGCGGCGWQHVAAAAQSAAKAQLVADALARLGRVGDVEVTSAPPLAGAGFRTTVRCAVRDGRAGFRRSRSRDVVAVPTCPVAHPLLADLLAGARFPDAREVTLRCGARTGQRLVLVRPSRPGRFVAPVVPPDVVVAGPDGDGVYHEDAAGRRWRISATSFFQTRADGADLLVARVRALLPERPERVLDAYCGVGLLSAAVTDADLIAVESHPAAAADARVNLAGRGATVVEAPVERWRPEPVDVVIADPARRGLRATGAAVVAGTGAGTVVLVSCDAASLGRDAGLLGAHGYRIDHCEVLDLFPHTPHVEVITRFRRS